MESVKLNLHELTEARGVVVAGGLGVAEGLHQITHNDAVRTVHSKWLRKIARSLTDLQDRVALHHFRGEALLIVFATTERGEILEGDLGRLGLSRAALAADDDRLADAGGLHLPQRLVGDGVHVRRHHTDALADVVEEHILAVDWKPLEGVHGDQDVARVGVDLVLGVAARQIVQQSRLVQVHQLRVVADAVLRARVDGVGVLGLDGLLLATDGHDAAREGVAA